MYMTEDYQLKFDDDTTRQAVIELVSLHEISTLPYPLIYMPVEKKQEIAAIWKELGSWCEVSLTWFVTGDVELNDATWNSFVNDAKTRGADQLTAVFQSMLE